MKKTTAFQCEFCDKTSLNKSTIKSHERKCFSNPKRRACQTCKKHFENHPCGIELAFDCPEWEGEE